MRTPRFKEGDIVTFKSISQLLNKEYFYGGDDQGGISGKIIKVYSDSSPANGIKVEVQFLDNCHRMQRYSMLEEEFVEYSNKISESTDYSKFTNHIEPLYNPNKLTKFEIEFWVKHPIFDLFQAFLLEHGVLNDFIDEFKESTYPKFEYFINLSFDDFIEVEFKLYPNYKSKWKKVNDDWVEFLSKNFEAYNIQKACELYTSLDEDECHELCYKIVDQIIDESTILTQFEKVTKSRHPILGYFEYFLKSKNLLRDFINNYSEDDSANGKEIDKFFIGLEIEDYIEYKDWYDDADETHDYCDLQEAWMDFCKRATSNKIRNYDRLLEYSLKIEFVIPVLLSELPQYFDMTYESYSKKIDSSSLYGTFDATKSFFGPSVNVEPLDVSKVKVDHNIQECKIDVRSDSVFKIQSDKDETKRTIKFNF